MKEREENRIKELFHELRRDDERRAPAFARTMDAALSRSVKTHRGWQLLPVAAATVMLILIGLSVFIIFRQSSTKTYQAAEVEPVAPPDQSSQPEVIVSAPRKNGSPNKNGLPNKNGSPDRIESPKPGKRRVARQRKLSPTLISDWQSPTDFLLETSGRQLLRTTPRVDESITSIKGLFPEKMN
jgi:hypothetical protein